MEVEDLIQELNQAAQGTDVVDSHHASSCQALADELLALQSIYALEDPKALRIVSLYLSTDVEGRSDEKKKQLSHWQQGCQIRLALDLPLHLPSPSNHRDPSDCPSSLRLSITVPPSYPDSQSAPQFQLLDRFIGDYEVDSSLFGRVLRTFLHDQYHHHDGQLGVGRGDGIRWQRGEVVLFEGCESVKELVEEWYKEQRSRGEERKRKDGRAGVGVVAPVTGEPDSSNTAASNKSQQESYPHTNTSTTTPSPSLADESLAALIKSKRWTSTAPLVERKSTFIGHAIRLDRPEEVPLLLQSLLALHPRMEKATHPFMRAWVCSTEMEEERSSGSGGRKVLHRDCDDDGESAAGGRLAHLLEMLHIENVLVVVTRYYGGIQLGADRFKLINRVAREALDLAGLLTP